MLSIQDRHHPGDRLARREWLRVGGLSALGLSLPTLLRQASAAAPAPPTGLSRDVGGTFGKAKNVIFLWLQGGPPQHETFDPKPEAPSEIRGPFKPIATNVPGIQIGELLPRTSRYADKLAIVRSLSTRDDNHDVSAYWLLTGYPYGPGSARQIKPGDWPYFGSIVKMLKPSDKLPALSSVWIPDLMRLNDNVTPAGQTAGFLGQLWEPERFVGDPAAADYEIDGLKSLPDVAAFRVDRRRDLLEQMQARFDRALRGESLASWHQLSQQAFDLVTSGAARAAFDLSRETDQTRDRYGRYTWGQSVLLARRLIEAGVRLVHVNWARDPGDNAVDNPMWDTHALNADRLQDNLCPQFDPTFAALMDDLAERGLLEETLVVVIGEFGRTPKINAHGGRDHWGHVFSFAMAGAGIQGGQVIGASDRQGAYPATTPITGGDLTATIFHLLGVDPHGVFHDKEDRPHPITKGYPIAGILTSRPASPALQPAAGDPAFVPLFDTRLLFDVDFETDLPLVPVAPATRDKGWRGWPLPSTENVVMAVVKSAGAVELGYAFVESQTTVSIDQGSRALLAQEIRNARGGQFTFSVRASGVGTSPEEFEQMFLTHFRARLVIFRFQDMRKDPRIITELGALEFHPVFGKPQEFVLDRFLGPSIPGTNFSIGSGLGVLIDVEKRTPGSLTLSPGATRRAGVRIEVVSLAFSPRQRDENVTV